MFLIVSLITSNNSSNNNNNNTRCKIIDDNCKAILPAAHLNIYTFVKESNVNSYSSIEW
jgi:hypothetical protein